MAPTIPNPNVILYLNRMFGITNPFSLSNDEMVQQLTQSGFTTVILFALQVSTDNGGDIYFSGTSPIASEGSFDPDSVFGYLPPIVSGLTASGSSITNVLFSIGGGSGDTWSNINTLLGQSSNNLAANFGAIQTALGINGWDFDNEQTPTAQGCAAMTTLLSNGGSNVISWSPYFDPQGWANALAIVYSANGSQLTSWLNLQCYGGGTGNQPSQWISAITSTSSMKTGLDATQAQAFVIPGFDPISSLQNTLAALADESPFPTTVSPLAGAFYWGANSIFMATMNPQNFAQAILFGL